MNENVKQIAEHFGLDSQLIKLQEECSEVVQAICKMQIEGFTPERVKEFVGELADKSLVTKQVVYLMSKLENHEHISSAVTIVEGQKIDRTIERYGIGGVSDEV